MFSSSSASSTPGPSRSRSIFGITKNESRMETPPPADTSLPRIELPTPPPATYAAYHDAHTTPNVLDDFFGANPSPAYQPPSRVRVSMPPPYAPYGHEVVEVEQGVYAVQEPPTLARMLFYYGFLFFPFWLAGIYIFFSPLLPTTDWEAGKTEDEKKQLLQILRETEKKWARRCLFSMLGLTVTVLILVVIIKYGILGNI